MATLAQMTPVLLAFDTSTEVMAVALQWRSGRLARNAEGGAQASAGLLPAVQGLLDEAGIGLNDLDAIAFGCGPGAFTGLRTSCSVAQGLAYGADKPVLPVDSLLIVAEDELASRGNPAVLDVDVAMDARMGELYAASYRWIQGRWRVLQPPGLWEPGAWRDHLSAAKRHGTPVVWAGSGLTLLEPDTEPAGSGAGRTDLPVHERAQLGRVHCLDRAAALLRLSDQGWRQGAALAPEQALPVYLRDKVALTTTERQALKAGA